MPDTLIDSVIADAETHLEQSLERLFELLRIPSISTDSAYAAECLRAAEWLRAELAGLEFQADVRPTAGHPSVIAHRRAGRGPHVLFYGHYDVQPADPLELWTSPPFEPAIITSPDGVKRITGRGSSDDKGQLMTFIEACRAWLRVTGALPVSVSVLLEGEEESGSPNLAGLVEQAADELKADVALICDTELWDAETPAIVSMLRGLSSQEFTVTAASRDLHSGSYGSAARNPLQVVAEIVASLRAPDGSVAIDGFYDDVAEVPEAIRTVWDRLEFDGAAFLGEVGLSLPAGEADRSVLEQLWSRPTCEINGMWGGYTGEGTKTVIPSKAHAKVTFRLVANQDPKRVEAAFRDHVRARVPADCSVEFKGLGWGGAVSVATDGPLFKRAAAALGEEWGKEPVVIGAGGSIPVVGMLSEQLGMDSLLIGFARDDDNIHSPNEKYDLDSFRRGVRSWIRILGALAEA